MRAAAGEPCRPASARSRKSPPAASSAMRGAPTAPRERRFSPAWRAGLPTCSRAGSWARQLPQRRRDVVEVALRNVTKVYPGGVAAVRDVTFTIADGQFCVLVGPSGCGKSTLLRMVAGLETITGGEVALGGEVVNAREPAERDIAMVFQNYALYPHMSVYDNMAYGLRNRRVPRAEIDAPVREAARDRRAARPQATRTLRRPAPARRHGARDRAAAQGIPVRRAPVEPRRQAARLHAGGNPQAPARLCDHLRLRDPRPARGNDA